MAPPFGPTAEILGSQTLPPGVAAQLVERAVDPTRAADESCEQFEDRLDTALMALWRDTRDEAAFEALYAHACGRVLAWLRWLVRGERSPCDPSDLLQDTFVNVYRYGRGFLDRGPASFRCWVRTIAGNVMRRAATRGRSRRRGELSLEDLPEGFADPVDPADGPQLRLVEGEEREALLEAWSLFLAHYAGAYAALSPRDRRALRLVEVEGISYAQTCARLEVSASNMKMIMLRARRRLQAHMRAAMGAEELPTARLQRGAVRRPRAEARLADVG